MSRAGSKLFRVELEVKAYDREGRLIAERRRETDLILDNFKEILAAMLTPHYSWSAVTGGGVKAAEVLAPLVDTGGTARDTAIHGVYTVGTANSVPINILAVSGYNSIGAGDFGVRIEIGTSTVAPSRSDYKLGAKVAEGTPTKTVGVDYISWAVSIVLETAADIAEAGLYLRANLSPTGAPWYIGGVLLFRDTFTPISVPAGGTISVTYKLTL